MPEWLDLLSELCYCAQSVDTEWSVRGLLWSAGNSDGQIDRSLRGTETNHTTVTAWCVSSFVGLLSVISCSISFRTHYAIGQSLALERAAVGVSNCMYVDLSEQYIIKGYGEIAEQFERLALITFDETRTFLFLGPFICRCQFALIQQLLNDASCVMVLTAQFAGRVVVACSKPC